LAGGGRPAGRWMMDDERKTRDESALAPYSFQFDLRAILAVTATCGVVLGFLGRPRVFEILAATVVFGFIALIAAIVVRFSRHTPFASSAQRRAALGWFLLGALGGYIIVASTDAYGAVRDRGVWAFACGLAAQCGTLGTSGGSPRSATMGSMAGAFAVAPAFLLNAFMGRPGFSLTASLWEVTCAAVAGAAIALTVDVLRRLETHWQLPGYTAPCVWLVGSSGVAHWAPRLIAGW
ncbi:MAG: hypothetical protein KDA63_03065, partial [Planctomycetales bacterium]|nr:hypothetical protein [Planctomycetales bacterium]